MSSHLYQNDINSYSIGYHGGIDTPLPYEGLQTPPFTDMSLARSNSGHTTKTVLGFLSSLYDDYNGLMYNNNSVMSEESDAVNVSDSMNKYVDDASMPLHSSSVTQPNEKGFTETYLSNVDPSIYKRYSQKRQVSEESMYHDQYTKPVGSAEKLLVVTSSGTNREQKSFGDIERNFEGTSSSNTRMALYDGDKLYSLDHQQYSEESSHEIYNSVLANLQRHEISYRLSLEDISDIVMGAHELNYECLCKLQQVSEKQYVPCDLPTEKLSTQAVVYPQEEDAIAREVAISAIIDDMSKQHQKKIAQIISAAQENLLITTAAYEDQVSGLKREIAVQASELTELRENIIKINNKIKDINSIGTQTSSEECECIDRFAPSMSHGYNLVNSMGHHICTYFNIFFDNYIQNVMELLISSIGTAKISTDNNRELSRYMPYVAADTLLSPTDVHYSVKGTYTVNLPSFEELVPGENSTLEKDKKNELVTVIINQTNKIKQLQEEIVVLQNTKSAIQEDYQENLNEDKTHTEQIIRQLLQDATSSRQTISAFAEMAQECQVEVLMIRNILETIDDQLFDNIHHFSADSSLPSPHLATEDVCNMRDWSASMRINGGVDSVQNEGKDKLLLRSRKSTTCSYSESSPFVTALQRVAAADVARDTSASYDHTVECVSVRRNSGTPSHNKKGLFTSPPEDKRNVLIYSHHSY